MATLSDQITYLALPNDTTEHHSDTSSNPKSSQSKGRDLVSSDGKSNDKYQSLFPDDTFWLVASIAGGAVFAFAIAVWHHAILSYLHGRNVADFSQIWIKGAGNGLANIFSICVGFSAATALTQMKWRVSGNEPLPMYTIDNLFALPAPLVLLKTVMRPRRSLFLPILSSVLIQSLVVVSILAPSALTIAPSEKVSKDIKIPILDLEHSSGQFATMDYKLVLPSSGSSPLLTLWYVNMSDVGNYRINSLFLKLPEVPWTIPPVCGLNCAFHFRYEAPALDCRDVIIPRPLSGSNNDINVYEASTSLYPHYNSTVSPNRLLDAPYELSINYTTYNYSPGVYRAGTYCRFHWGVYNASFELNSGIQQIKTSIISYSDDYLSLKDSSVNPDQVIGFLNNWAICYTFANIFRANISWPLRSQDAYKFSSFLQYIFNFNDYKPSDDMFTSVVPNISQTLVDLFSNLTLSILLAPGDGDRNTTIVSSKVWDGTSVWIYTTWILWAVYLPALILAIPVILYGLFTIHMSRVGMDDKFSSILLATRNAELDEICKEYADFEELQKFRLAYRERGTFTVDFGIKSPGWTVDTGSASLSQ